MDLCRDLPRCLSVDFVSGDVSAGDQPLCYLQFYDELSLEWHRCVDNYEKKDCSDILGAFEYTVFLLYKVKNQ